MTQPLNVYIDEYRKQLAIGHIQKAYQGLMQYIMALRTHFINTYPNGFISGALSTGHMDITYFPFTPKVLKAKKLKIVLVFNHDKFQFEICLIGQNKNIQKQYWEHFKTTGYDKYRFPTTAEDVVIYSVLTEKPNFNQLDALTAQIDTKAMVFISDINTFLTGLQPR